MILKKFFFFLLFCLSAAKAIAQVSDNFDDSDLSSNPEWQGDVIYFTVENNLLRSNGPADINMIYLSSSIELYQEQEWQLYLKLDFAPSGSNRFRFYLASDSVNPEKSSNAIYLEIGQTGSDVYKLKAKEDGVAYEILQSKKSYSGNVEDNIRIYKDASDSWTLYFKDEFNEYIADSSAVYPVVFSSPDFYGGFVCQYTSTRSKLFFMDNFYTGPVLQDKEPPVLESFTILNEYSLQLYFSEPLGESISQQNFKLNNNSVPQIASVLGNKIELTFEQEFLEENNQLTIASIPDKYKNYLQDTTIAFNHYKISAPKAGDVLINEIMADPSPPVELPEVEYVELWNRTDKHFDLHDFQLNGRMVSANQRLLKRNSYMILCRARDTTDLKEFGDVAGMISWDVLSNSEDKVLLSYQDNILLDSINYNLEWYGSSSRSGGGFSLERISADYPCDQRFNWIASDDMLGGTPGRINSNANAEPDIAGPQLVSAWAKDSVTVELVFNEPVNPASVQLHDFVMQDINFVDFSAGSYDTIRLFSDGSLLSNNLYNLRISNLSDCNGNVLKEINVSLVLPMQIEKGDLVINEILFDPYPSGVDFVEIYNVSNKYINISEAHLSNDSLSSYLISKNPSIMAPGQFLALAIDTNRIKNDYPKAGNIFQSQNMPPLSNSGGDIYLMVKDNILDFLSFSPDYHLPFLHNVEGVSLERISALADGQDKNNWTSASSSSGYATPGLLNSQSLTNYTTEKPISLSSPYLTPDQNGDLDFVIINYNFTESMIGSFSIYDPFGKKIKVLSNNSTLAINGQYRWDGTNEEGELMKTGHYLIIAEIFSVSGESYIFREKVVVLR